MIRAALMYGDEGGEIQTNVILGIPVDSKQLTLNHMS